MCRLKLLFVIVCIFCAGANAGAFAKEAAKVDASFVSQKTQVSGDESFWVAVKFNIAKGWHTYYKDPGETGEATEIKLYVPKGFVVSDILWQEPKVFDTVGFTEYGYDDEVYHFLKVTPPSGLGGDEIKLAADVSWVACGYGECVPDKATLNMVLPVGENGALVAGFGEALQKVQGNAKEAAKSQSNQNQGLLFILLSAFVGGILLNLMPCVFPVMSLKIFGLMKASKGTIRKNSLFYTLGIVATFMAVAAALLIVKSAGGALGWGFQLQNPVFVLFMICLLMVLGLMFSGFITLSPFIKGVSVSKNGAFMSGVLAVLLASPCVAPFMGTAVAYGLTASGKEAVGVFFAMGLGLAFPILILSFFRGWVRLMPKSGRWMKVVQEVLAIPLYLSVVWLLWVLEKQTGSFGLMVAAAMLAIIVVAAIIRKKTVWWAFLAILILASFVIKDNVQKEKDMGFWKAYSEETLKNNLDAGNAVFLKFSAAWCLTCLMNEKLVLNSPETELLFKKYDVMPMAADWTAKDEGILKALNGYGKNGVPLYVFYKKGQSKPIILPRIITKTDVEKTVKDE